jgi:hypothetical protein
MNLEIPIERKHNNLEIFGDDPVVASRIVLVLSDPGDRSL